MKVYLLCTLFVGSCIAQKKISVYNSENHIPISYANIWKDNAFYKTADSIGVFTIDDKTPETNLKITAIGFEDKILSSSVNEVLLKPQLNVLDEVKITKKKNPQRESFGKFKKAGTVMSAVQYDAKMALVAKFFPNDKMEERFLNAVKFYTVTEDKNRIISLLFYTNENGEPGKLINSDNIICRLKKGNHLNTIDVSGSDIVFPKEGVFVVLQYMLLEQNKNYSKQYKNPLAFFYEPALYMKKVSEYTDTWYVKDLNWTKSTFYSLSLGIEVTD